MNRTQKRNLAIAGLAIAGGALAFMMTSSASAAPAVDDELEDDELEDDDEQITLDDIETRSPGLDIPIPSPSQPTPVPSPSQPVPTAPPVVVPSPRQPFPVPPEVPKVIKSPIPGVIPDIPIPTPVVDVPEVDDDEPAAPPVVVSPPVIPGPQPLPDLSGVDPVTADLVATLLRDEKSPGWKRISSQVRAWQVARGLKGDGKFGPGSATKLAMEVGTIPIVRFWPLAAGPRPDLALEDYRRGLERIAQAKGGQHGALLLRSAEREQGQSFGPPQGTGGKLPVLEGF